MIFRLYRNLKTAKGIVPLCLAVIAFFSMACEELEFANPNAPIVDDVTVQSLVTGVESGIRTETNIYIWVVSVLGREAYYFEPADPRYTGELLFGTVDPGGFLVNRPWTARYRAIANCNFLLDRAASLSGAEKAGLEGFAKTMIGYQLLLNLNYLDENGIKLDFSGDLSAPFVSKSQAFSEIERYLDEGNTALGSAGGSFPFTLSGGFAGFDTPAGFSKFNRALRARAAIYQLDNAGALAALGGSFIDRNAAMDLGVYHVYGTGLGDQGNPIFESPDAAFVKFMGHPTFATDAEAGDRRFATKVRIRSDATTFDNLTSNLGVTLSGSSTDPFPIIRNEELLLIRAEANIGQGNLGDAEADINAVRAAAGLGEVTLTSADQALNQVLFERRYSLFAEGHRWVDMRRHGRLNTLPVDRATDVVLDKMPRPETEVKEGN
jgi:hypothetical protein